jgi:hypothetical protein
MFGRIMDALHPVFAWLNAAMFVFNVVEGNLYSAVISGVLAAILFWQMTW